MKRLNSKGQSMVEYALGLGCVTALLMVALGAVGSGNHLGGGVIHKAQSAIDYGGKKAPDSPRTISVKATSWVLN